MPILSVEIMKTIDEREIQKTANTNTKNPKERKKEQTNKQTERSKANRSCSERVRAK